MRITILAIVVAVLVLFGWAAHTAVSSVQHSIAVRAEQAA